MIGHILSILLVDKKNTTSAVKPICSRITIFMALLEATLEKEQKSCSAGRNSICISPDYCSVRLMFSTPEHVVVGRIVLNKDQVVDKVSSRC